MDGGQSQGPFLLIFNLRDQSDVLCKSQGPFWLKSLLDISIDISTNLHIDISNDTDIVNID